MELELKEQKLIPHVIYLHCHRLNLVLVKLYPRSLICFSSCKLSKVLVNQWSKTWTVTSSTSWRQLFELEKLAETRWCYWYRSVSKVKHRIENIVNVLEALLLQKIDRLLTAEAQRLLPRICSMAFLCSFLVAKKLLGTVNSLSEELQNRSVDYIPAEMLIESTKRDLLAYHNIDTWTSTVKEADAIGAQIGVPLEWQQL